MRLSAVKNDAGYENLQKWLPYLDKITCDGVVVNPVTADEDKGYVDLNWQFRFPLGCTDDTNLWKLPCTWRRRGVVKIHWKDDNPADNLA